MKIIGKASLVELENYNPKQFEILQKRLITKLDYPTNQEWAKELDVHNPIYFWAIAQDAYSDISKGKLVYLSETGAMEGTNKFSKRSINSVIVKKKYLLIYYVCGIDKKFIYKNDILKG